MYVSPEAMADKMLMDRVLIRLDADLKKIHELLPPAAMKPLEGVTFWVERDNPGMTMYYHGRTATGINPDKRGGIDVNSMQKYLDGAAFKPFLVLHEMSHAYHDLVLGFDNGIVKWAFDLAVASHRYESVSRNGRKERAYALTNEREYFAEISSSYWGRNDYYPFTRADLAQFDPPGLAMIEKVWLGASTIASNVSSCRAMQAERPFVPCPNKAPNILLIWLARENFTFAPAPVLCCGEVYT